MFNNKALLEEIEDLKRENASLKDTINSKDDRTLSVVYDDIDSCNFGFDWAKVNAFSIERNHRTDFGSVVAYTLIGYLRPEDNTVGEWTLVCSQEEHNRLAAQFDAYTGKSKPSATKAALLTESKPTTRAKK
jgi:hypothetical protein